MTVGSGEDIDETEFAMKIILGTCIHEETTQPTSRYIE